MDSDKKIILFGAGQFGGKALRYFGQDRVYCFADNNEKLAGQKIHNVPVISFQQLKEIYKEYRVVISTDAERAFAIAAQLEDAGITQYEVFLKILQADSKKQTAEITVQNQSALGLEEKNRVLMVAYCFPPLSGSGVFRSIKFAKYLPQFGWHPTVIATDAPQSSWNYSDESLLKEIPADAPVIRISDPISTFQGSFTEEIQKQLLDFLKDIFQESEEAYALYTSFLANKTDTAKLLVFPCSALLWAYKVVQYIETAMDIHDFRVIYTTSSPFSAHLIGCYFKRKYGIPWVADYRDQWTGDPTRSFDPNEPFDRLLFFLESIMLRNADYNITPGGSGVVEDYINRFQLPEGKIVSITNGYDEADFAPFGTKAGRNDKFTINYSGLLHVKRNIDAVLASLQELIAEGQIDLAKVQFRIVGDAREYDPGQLAQKYGLESIIVQTGYLSHSEAIRSNIEANLLLLLVGDDERYRHVPTGKIFDYLRSGRPILALAPSGGMADQILRETGHGKAFAGTQIPEIKAMILAEYRRWQSGEIPELLHSPQIGKYERKALTGHLAQLFAEAASLPAPAAGPALQKQGKYLVICNGGYPMEGNPRCMFAHERVLEYIKAGLDVDAFGFIWNAPRSQYKFDGVDVTEGGAPVLQELLQKNHYDKLLIHFADDAVMYTIQEAGRSDMPMIVWCHGYEVLPWYDLWFDHPQAQIEQKAGNWDLFDSLKRDHLRKIYAKDNIRFIFVSAWLMERSKKFVGILPKHCDVIHNYINCEFFASPAKKSDDRFHILSIKNHSTRMYANDLTAKAILKLSEREFFSKLTFELYGDGGLFEENFGELIQKNFSNVHIHRKILSHSEMRALFRSNGICLSPTRLDTQGVTSCEAMAAGMPVVTSCVGAVPEFIDENCGSLFEFDNYWMMAEEIEYLYLHPDEFLRKSENAVQRMRTQCGYDQTIGRELRLFTGA